MPTFQVRNRRTKMILGEVTVDEPGQVLDGLKDATGSSIEEIALALGSTVEEAKAALDIVVLRETVNARDRRQNWKLALPRRRLFA